ANGADKFTFTATDSAGVSEPAEVTISITAVNDAPVAVIPGLVNITVDENSGKYTKSGFATSASAGASNESSQKTSYVVVLNSGGASLFAEAPTISEDGTLSFVPAAEKNGTATLTVFVKDDGGVANGGVDTAVANSGSGSFTVHSLLLEPILKEPR
ncbi:MAG: Ig-like domain-containing protein, partial [Verrucomicrobia bacterium]|nr:Ig-like domain-containing protein [Verrucomicrobiota bacterium]